MPRSRNQRIKRDRIKSRSKKLSKLKKPRKKMKKKLRRTKRRQIKSQNKNNLNLKLQSNQNRPPLKARSVILVNRNYNQILTQQIRMNNKLRNHL